MTRTRPSVQTGLDRLLDDREELETLEGAALGLLVNPTSVTADLEHAIDACLAEGLDVRRLFGPEHGVRGQAQDMEAVDQQRDPISGIPTVSLYGGSVDSLRPDPEYLEDLDILVADLQDVGARYYTYASTIGYVMDVCGDVGVEVRVLDSRATSSRRRVDPSLAPSRSRPATE
jgi:uncharacterized protein YbbC (DUF1343 family)